MTKPKIPLPGDILTADQVNARLEHVVEQVNKALQEQGNRITALASALAGAMQALDAIPHMINESMGKPMPPVPTPMASWPPTAVAPPHNPAPPDKEFAPIGYGVRIIGHELWQWYTIDPANHRYSEKCFKTYAEAVADAHRDAGSKG